MNTKNTSIIILVGFLLHFNAAFSQNSYQLGFLPSFNLNSKFKNNWSLNSRIESRQLISRGEFKDNFEKNYAYVLTDISMIAAKKVGLNSRVAGGYLIRIEDGNVIHRLIQQYSIVQKLSTFRIVHRLVTDQTISRIEKPDFRLRYRIALEKPLNGVEADPGEFYLKVNHEYLNSLQDLNYDLEIRLVPLLGLNATEKFNVETGLDYRVNSFINKNARHSFWICLNLFVEI